MKQQKKKKIPVSEREISSILWTEAGGDDALGRALKFQNHLRLETSYERIGTFIFASLSVRQNRKPVVPALKPPGDVNFIKGWTMRFDTGKPDIQREIYLHTLYMYIYTYIFIYNNTGEKRVNMFHESVART